MPVPACAPHTPRSSSSPSCPSSSSSRASAPTSTSCATSGVRSDARRARQTYVRGPVAFVVAPAAVILVLCVCVCLRPLLQVGFLAGPGVCFQTFLVASFSWFFDYEGWNWWAHTHTHTSLPLPHRLCSLRGKLSSGASLPAPPPLPLRPPRPPGTSPCSSGPCSARRTPSPSWHSSRSSA